MDIFKTVLNLRSERMFMVQKYAQYEYLYKCTDYLLNARFGTFARTSVFQSEESEDLEYVGSISAFLEE